MFLFRKSTQKKTLSFTFRLISYILIFQNIEHNTILLADECPLNDIDDIENGKFTLTTTYENTVKIYNAKYECISGFKLVGNDFQRCSPDSILQDGEHFLDRNSWSGTPPYCKRIGIVTNYFITYLKGCFINSLLLCSMNPCRISQFRNSGFKTLCM